MSNGLLMWENILGQIHLPATPVLPKQNPWHPISVKREQNLELFHNKDNTQILGKFFNACKSWITIIKPLINTKGSSLKSMLSKIYRTKIFRFTMVSPPHKPGSFLLLLLKDNSFIFPFTCICICIFHCLKHLYNFHAFHLKYWWNCIKIFCLSNQKSVEYP